jgi:BASS family bile acid:Na+ symporter
MYRGSRLAELVKRHLLWLLIGSYALAAWWPAPGLVMRQWQWSLSGLAVPISLPLLLLALMLFSAALVTDVGQLRRVGEQPLPVGLGLIAVWLGPALLVVAASAIVPAAISGHSTSGMLVGLALVACMPVANSSAGWTQNTDGNLSFSLALVVFSITLSPWITPRLLHLLSISLSPSEQEACRALADRFSGVFFVGWVLAPTAAGFVGRFLLTPRRVSLVSAWCSLASAAALLVLNYINAALALPTIRDAPLSLIMTTAALATALGVVGLMIGWAISRWLGVSPPSRNALLFGLSMKHTGLALVLAGVVLTNQPLAILVIVLATLTQHLLAGVVQWRFRCQVSGVGCQAPYPTPDT